MPSSGYGAGDEGDLKALASLRDEAEKDRIVFSMLAEILAVYVAARLQGATPNEALQAGYIEIFSFTPC